MSSISVISIGSDRTLFKPGSAAHIRTAAYAARLGELHVVVFALRSQGFRETHAGALHLYPTNSRSRLSYVFDAARMARHLPADVLTVQDPFEAGLAGLIARKGRPLHVQVHTDPFAPGFRHGLNIMRLILALFVFARATRIRAVSQQNARKLRSRYSRVPVSALPIFVDLQKYRGLTRTPRPRFKTTLLWVGRFEREKNPALALRALAQTTDTGLVMLGSGRLEPRLRELVKNLHLEDRVEMPGWRDPAEFLGSANLLLVTSKYEGYGRQIVEALAAGVPVLSTDVGVAREAGAVITAEKEFSAALTEWLQSGKRRATLKNYPYQNFAEYVEKYCADLEAAAHT